MCPTVTLLASGTGDNATATATLTGTAGLNAFITKIVGSFDSAPAAAKVLTWKDGTTVKGQRLITNSHNEDFWPPLRISAGADTVATLAASGGAGNVGYVYIYGWVGDSKNE